MPDDLGDLYVIGQHSRVHAAHRQERRGHPHRARHHRPRRQADAGVLRDDEDRSSSTRAGTCRTRSRCSELYPSLARGGTSFRAPGPAPVAQRPRHRPRERRLELDRHPQLTTSISRRAPSNVLGEVKFTFPNKHDRLHARHANARHLFEEASRAVQPRLHARARSAPHGRDPAGRGQGLGRGADRRPDRQRRRRTTRCRSTARSPCTSPTSRPGSTTQGELQTARDVYGHEKRITQALTGRVGADRQGTQPPRAGARAAGVVSYGGGFGSVGDFISQALGGF